MLMGNAFEACLEIYLYSTLAFTIAFIKTMLTIRQLKGLTEALAMLWLLLRSVGNPQRGGYISSKWGLSLNLIDPRCLRSLRCRLYSVRGNLKGCSKATALGPMGLVR